MNRGQTAQSSRHQGLESALLPVNLVVSDGCVHRRLPRGRQVDRDGALTPDTSPVHGSAIPLPRRQLPDQCDTKGDQATGGDGSPCIRAPRRSTPNPFEINHLRCLGMTRVPSNVADLVGRTPVVRLTHMTDGNDVQLFAKLEALNPGGSVKDRIGVAMIEAAEREGRIEPGRTTIVEATSGNTGIALAMVCAARGYELLLTLPQGMSRERTALRRQYGARVELVDSLGGMTEAVERARELAAGEDVFLPDQFSNPANPEIHRRTTGPEILEALGGRVDALVAGVGTGGTITGAGEALKARNARCRVIAVEPS